MVEFAKGVCCLVVMAGVGAGLLSWFHDRPDSTIWLLRLGSPLLAIVGLLIVIKLQFRKDTAPDYLRQLLGWRLDQGQFFDRGGFCFGFRTTSKDGHCELNAYFQNRHERPCRGQIALRPARNFFLNRNKFDAICIDVECGAGAFGFATLPIPIPAAFQGKRQQFEVGASVKYPHGRGRKLRHSEGMVLRTNSKFANTFGSVLTVAGALGGSVVISSPAKVTLDLPFSVAEKLPDGLEPAVRTLWTLGDPPLELER
jgi:hypothetical protein